MSIKMPASSSFTTIHTDHPSHRSGHESPWQRSIWYNWRQEAWRAKATSKIITFSLYLFNLGCLSCMLKPLLILALFAALSVPFFHYKLSYMPGLQTVNDGFLIVCSGLLSKYSYYNICYWKNYFSYLILEICMF